MGFSPEQQISPLSALDLALLGQCVFDLEEAWLKSRSESLMEGTQVPRPTLLGVVWGTSDQIVGERLKIRGAARIFQGSATMEGLERTESNCSNDITCLLHKTRKLEMLPMENSVTRHG